MTRPKCKYNIEFSPKATGFAPEGISCKECDTIEISPEEAEALRLKELEDLDQTAAAKKMRVSQSTFQRVLARARKKVSFALIEGKKLRIIKTKRTHNEKRTTRNGPRGG